MDFSPQPCGHGSQTNAAWAGLADVSQIRQQLGCMVHRAGGVSSPHSSMGKWLLLFKGTATALNLMPETIQADTEVEFGLILGECRPLYSSPCLSVSHVPQPLPFFLVQWARRLSSWVLCPTHHPPSSCPLTEFPSCSPAIVLFSAASRITLCETEVASRLFLGSSS